MITLVEHKSSSYAPRTYHNAAQGVTLAYAVDHKTAGEKLTQKAAGENIVMIDAKHTWDKLYPARALYKKLRDTNTHVVNVAGNGIYTFDKHGFDQKRVNDEIYFILSKVHEHWPIEKVVSGGQSGADIAGLIAAERLGIDSVGTWPNGFKMRFSNGKDVNHTQEEIMEIINAYL